MKSAAAATAAVVVAAAVAAPAAIAAEQEQKDDGDDDPAAAAAAKARILITHSVTSYEISDALWEPHSIVCGLRQSVRAAGKIYSCAGREMR